MFLHSKAISVPPWKPGRFSHTNYNFLLFLLRERKMVTKPLNVCSHKNPGLVSHQILSTLFSHKIFTNPFYPCKRPGILCKSPKYGRSTLNLALNSRIRYQISDIRNPLNTRISEIIPRILMLLLLQLLFSLSKRGSIQVATISKFLLFFSSELAFFAE